MKYLLIMLIGMLLYMCGQIETDPRIQAQTDCANKLIAEGKDPKWVAEYTYKRVFQKGLPCQ